MADNGRALKALTAQHVPQALAIIEAHNPDDADAAQLGGPGDLGLWVDGELAGLTGAKAVDDCDGTFWLSWTYLSAAFRGAGHGHWMLAQQVARLKAEGARKLFVQVSDLPMYRRALAVYQRFGFRLEAHSRAFYTATESQRVLGLRLRPKKRCRIQRDERSARFTELFELEECDDALGIDWVFNRVGRSKPKTALPMIASARGDGARVLFGSAPSNAPRVDGLFRGAGFSAESTLADFYADGVDELRYRLDL